MEEEALRALSIARTKLSQGDHAGSVRFCKKSLSIHATSQAKAFLVELESYAATATATNGDAPQASSTATSTSASSSTTKKRTTTAAAEPSSSAPAYTSAQLAVVKRVKACQVHEYYKILDLEKGCDDAAVKKAYRKLALALHPDKCKAPGSEEAFKMVSKAFQILSDPQKRSIYDQTGSDPDSRFSSAGPSAGFAGRSPFAAGGGRSPFGDDEISPEDLFRMFFGAGGGPFGGGFGGPGIHVFSGPGGARFTTMGGGGMPRRRAGAAGGQGQQNETSTWLQVAPLLILFLFSLLTQLPSLFGGTSVPDPDFAFRPDARFSVRQMTHSNKNPVDYYVNPRQFAIHPIYADVLSANPALGFASRHNPGTNAYKADLAAHLESYRPVQRDEAKQRDVNLWQSVPTSLAKFERNVENAYVQTLQSYCRDEIARRQDRLERAKGFFGIGADWDKFKQIEAEKLEHCERLSKFGYNVRY